MIQCVNNDQGVISIPRLRLGPINEIYLGLNTEHPS